MPPIFNSLTVHRLLYFSLMLLHIGADILLSINGEMAMTFDFQSCGFIFKHVHALQFYFHLLAIGRYASIIWYSFLERVKAGIFYVYP